MSGGASDRTLPFFAFVFFPLHFFFFSYPPVTKREHRHTRVCAMFLSGFSFRIRKYRFITVVLFCIFFWLPCLCIRDCVTLPTSLCHPTDGFGDHIQLICDISQYYVNSWFGGTQCCRIGCGPFEYPCLPVGAIVGICVGGVALLLGIALLYCRNRNVKAGEGIIAAEGGHEKPLLTCQRTNSHERPGKVFLLVNIVSIPPNLRPTTLFSCSNYVTRSASVSLPSEDVLCFEQNGFTEMAVLCSDYFVSCTYGLFCCSCVLSLKLP